MKTQIVSTAWSLIRRAWCRHTEYRMEHRLDGWVFICYDCGHVAPVIRKDQAND